MSFTKSPTRSFTTASTWAPSLTPPPPAWYQQTPAQRGKVVDLNGGGSVINGATLSSFKQKSLTCFLRGLADALPLQAPQSGTEVVKPIISVILHKAEQKYNKWLLEKHKVYYCIVKQKLQVQPQLIGPFNVSSSLPKGWVHATKVSYKFFCCQFW